ncbi:MAG: hypothetical protein ABIQ35_03110 [Verrucomicrobiota bacterium]
MNRSILIIICDFLLVSLLAFSTVDLNKTAEEGASPEVKTIISTNTPESGKDLAAVMKLALDDEKKSRDLLMGELASTRTTAGEREKQAQKFEQELKSQAQNFQQTLQAREQESQQLKQQQTNLEKQFAAAQTNLQVLNQKLQSTSTDATMSKEKLAALEAELKKRAQESAAYQQQLADLARTNQAVLSERQRLAGQLQVAEVEKRNAARQVVQMQEQVQVERAEKAKLAEGVKTLAAKSGELTQEIRENRPLAPNTIYSDFLSNRIDAVISASRPGLFVGESTKRKDSKTVIVSDGSRSFALFHVQDTPFTLWSPGTDWQKLSGSLSRDAAVVPIHSVSFHSQDPRIAFAPLTTNETKQLGGRIYRVSSTPFKFQDVVLVGVAEDYYGECRFEIDTTLPNYLKLNRSVVKGIFGKFNPSRGDLVFSKTGELLGIMANNTFCLMLRNFQASATFQFGPDVSSQRIGPTLSELQSTVVRMPLKLQ